MKIKLYLLLGLNILGIIPTLSMEQEYIDDEESEEYQKYQEDKALDRALSIYRQTKRNAEDTPGAEKKDANEQQEYLFETKDQKIVAFTAQEVALCKTLQDMTQDCEEELVSGDLISVAHSTDIFEQFHDYLKLALHRDNTALKNYTNELSLKNAAELLKIAHYYNCQILYEIFIEKVAHDLANILQKQDFDHANIAFIELEFNNYLQIKVCEYSLSHKNVKNVLNLIEKTSLKSELEDVGVYNIKLSRCGRYLASYYKAVPINSTIGLWGLESSSFFHKLKGHTQNIKSVKFNPNGTMAASFSTDNTIRVWDVKTGHCLAILEGHIGPVNSIRFSPDGTMLASCSKDNTIRLWCVKAGDQFGNCLLTLKNLTTAALSVRFSPDSTIIASKSPYPYELLLWDIKTGTCLHTLEGHTKLVYSMRFSKNNSMLASGSADGTIRLWDINTGACLHVLEGHTDNIRSIKFARTTDTVASGSDDNTIRVWDIKTGVCLYTLGGANFSGFIDSIKFSCDETKIIARYFNEKVRLWNNVENGTCLYDTWSRLFALDSRVTTMILGHKDITQVWNLVDQDLENALQSMDIPTTLLLVHIAEQYTITKKSVPIESRLLNQFPELIKQRLLAAKIVQEAKTEETIKQEDYCKQLLNHGWHF